MKKIALIFALAGLIGWAAPCRAQDKNPGQEPPPASAVEAAPASPIQEEALDVPGERPQRKMRVSERFGRSMANIFSSPLEIPAQIYVRAVYQENKTTNHFAVFGGLIEGIPMGALVYFPWRLFAGVADLTTLWWPECDPALIYPEYISFSPEFLDKTKLPLDKAPPEGKK